MIAVLCSHEGDRRLVKTTNLLQQFMVLVITNEQCFKHTYNVHNYNNICQNIIYYTTKLYVKDVLM